jgi:hypothetical protein
MRSGKKRLAWWAAETGAASSGTRSRVSTPAAKEVIARNIRFIERRSRLESSTFVKKITL